MWLIKKVSVPGPELHSIGDNFMCSIFSYFKLEVGSRVEISSEELRTKSSCCEVKFG